MGASTSAPQAASSYSHSAAALVPQAPALPMTPPLQESDEVRGVSPGAASMPSTPPFAEDAPQSHRTTKPGKSLLRQQPGPANGVRVPRLEFATSECLRREHCVKSYKDDESLWFASPGSLVECDTCGELAPYLGTNAQLVPIPGRPRFAQSEFLCETCSRGAGESRDAGIVVE